MEDILVKVVTKIEKIGDCHKEIRADILGIIQKVESYATTIKIFEQ